MAERSIGVRPKPPEPSDNPTFQSGAPKFAAPADIEQPPVDVAVDETHDDWRDMTTADKSKPILLTPDLETAVECYWRTTRQYVTKEVKWVDVAFWAVRNAAGAKIQFKPVGWRPIP